MTHAVHCVLMCTKECSVECNSILIKYHDRIVCTKKTGVLTDKHPLCILSAHFVLLACNGFILYGLTHGQSLLCYSNFYVIQTVLCVTFLH